MAAFRPRASSGNGIALLLPVLLVFAPRAMADGGPEQFFETRIRPVLAEHCHGCHGPEKQKSALRVDSLQALLKGGSRGPALSPGDAATSLLMQAVRHEQGLAMPPDAPLPQADIDALEAWVQAGAPWPAYDTPDTASAVSPMDHAKTHWAYQPVARHAPPAVQDAAWPRDPMDHFVLAGMESAGMAPAAPASKAALLRRLCFDLTGLPPAPELVRQFLADDAPLAYEAVVDQLLASPQFGEHWARHWLDVVRYTDSFDARASTLTDPAEIWRYRDWVVDSFNSDLPYDDFLRMQVAGDLLTGEEGGFNRDGLIATGVLAIGHWPQGDADKQKMVTDIVDDQVDLVTRGFMGISIACARCHDHKFEPFTMQDYYGLAGIFFSSSILPGPGAKTEGSPILHLPLASKEELARREAHTARVEELRGRINALLAEERDAFARQEAARAQDYIVGAMTGAQGGGLHPEAVQRWRVYLGMEPPRLNKLARDLNGLPGLHGRSGQQPMPSATINTTGEFQHYATIDHPDGALIVHPAPDAPARVSWVAPEAGSVQCELHVADADGACGDGFGWRLYTRGAAETTLAEGEVLNGKPADIPALSTTLRAGDALVLDILPRGDYSCDSTTVDWTITSGSGRQWQLRPEVVAHFDNLDGLAWRLEDPRGVAPDATLFAGLRDIQEGRAARFAATVQRRIARGQSMPDSPQAKGYAALIGEQGPFWIASPTPPAGSERPALEAEYARLALSPLPALELAVGIQEGGVPDTEHAGIHNVRIHRRGDYNNLGDEAPRRMPEMLTREQPAIGMEESGRRELASWLTDPANPLTARVAVNRLWQHVFGEGIVRTPGDFGVRGEAPTHPELLDYLAAEFVEGGWHVKPLIRRMVLSATYRQAAHNEVAIARDPENRLFARANRKRLSAEQLRDALLAVSGRLDLTPGGPAYPALETPRRTLYLRNVRSDRSTFTMLFDAADPTSIVPKRNEATIAPQALFLMNHPFVLAQAEELARAVVAHAHDTGALAQQLYLRLFGRDAAPHEIQLARTAMAQLGSEKESALEAYCQVLLSSNAFAFVD